MANKNSRLTQGADEVIQAEIYGDPESEWDGLQGADVWWVLTDEREGGTVVLEKASTDPDLSIDQDGGGSDPGIVTVELSDTDTEGLETQDYYQEIIVRDATGAVSADSLDPYVVTVRDSSIADVV